MNSPGSSTTKIQDLIPDVQAALQNRSDVNESSPNPAMRPSSWIRAALREITANNPFEELRQPNAPLVTIGPGLGVNGSNHRYNVSQFLLPGDDVTLTEDPCIFLNPSLASSVGLVGTNLPFTETVAYGMDYLTPKAIQPLLFVTGGVPFKYTRYGTQFWFGPQPGQNYQVYLPYQVRHPFNDANLPLSTVLVPPEWFDIIAYAAAERGAIALRWNDQSDYLHKKLYGDPNTAMGNGELAMPGLIMERKMQQTRDRRLSVVQITPSASRY
jgi:hypothetical protein